MFPGLALLICLAAILALLRFDQQWRSTVSSALWLPLLWLLILGSRPVSLWFAPAAVMKGGSAYLSYVDGNALDRAIYLAMIVSGLVILARRAVRWRQVISQNPWLYLFMGYCAVSILWSDYPFVAMKRWVKDFGNVVMVLIVMTEPVPAAAMRSLLLRATYVLVPLSVVLVKYFPDLARSYRRWSGDYFFMGVNTDKNMFGMVLTVLTIGVAWAWLDLKGEPASRRKTTQAVIFAIILLMIGWLLLGTNSATALICSSLGVAVLLLFRIGSVRRHVYKWAISGATIGLLLVMSGAWNAIQLSLIRLLGRDPGLHGRKDIWAAVLSERTNPVIGVGYYSFWSPERVERLSKTYYYDLNEAHNGYLEVYLNGGLIGIGLLIAFLAATASRGAKAVAAGEANSLGALRLALVATAVIYAVTEAVFNRMDMIWFGLLLVAAGTAHGATALRQIESATSTETTLSRSPRGPRYRRTTVPRPRRIIARRSRTP